jgi:polyphosphate glucokinase
MGLRAAKKGKGVVIAITIGSEIRSELFYNGRLIPNLKIEKILHSNDKLIEFHTAIFPVKKEQLKFEEWATRFDSLLECLKVVCTTNLLVLGSRISKK